MDTEVITPPETAPKRQRRARPPTVVHRSVAERVVEGKALRIAVPLAAHAEVAIDLNRPDPVELLKEADRSRVAELVPIKYGRMLVSPFTFYRGAAAVMAQDLAAAPRTGQIVQLCGDAHLSNFGLFASPERRVVFDINDFDETLPGPWEWDVKRLAASLEVAGRDNGFTRKERRKITTAAVASYRTTMAEFAGMRDLDVWYARADMQQVQDRFATELDETRAKAVAKITDKARTRDSMQAFGKLTTLVDGQRRIVASPPLIVPLTELLPGLQGQDLQGRFHELIREYRQTLQSDRRRLLERYRFADMARKVVGVGSVGTRCWVALLLGRDDNDPLFLQIKEAGPSVLAKHLGKSEYENQGHRVVAGQLLMQAVSDIFLGWQRTTGIDGVQRDFYVRQLRDWKMSVPIEALVPKGLRLYGELCGWSLARAHARSGDRVAIAAYLGSKDVFDVAIADFSEAYADQNERDYEALAAAARAGTVEAQPGL